MADLTIHQEETKIGAAPTQHLHVVDDGDLEIFETDGFSLYLALAISLIPAGMGIGATLAAWNATLPENTSILSGWSGIIYFGLTLVFLASGLSFLFPAWKNFRTIKTRVKAVRERGNAQIGVQLPSEKSSKLEPRITKAQTK